ncbi:MAG: hypothetical protein R6U65_02560 [Perlabentimonas sp.]
MSQKILFISALMGLGHIRALRPLALRFNRNVLLLGQTKVSDSSDKKFWSKSLRIYEWFSNASQLPIIGRLLFWFLDIFLYIGPLKETTRGAKTSFSLFLLDYTIKRGICKEIDNLNNPFNILVTSFYAPVSHMTRNRPQTPVVCQVCDTDLSRAWVPSSPNIGNVHYISTCKRSSYRLREYGVEASKIHLLGFPLPDELVGGDSQEIAINNYNRRYAKLNNDSILNARTPLKIAYPIGGAGVMVDNGIKAAIGLKSLVVEGKIELVFVPSPNNSSVNKLNKFKDTHFADCPNLIIANSTNLDGYFTLFNRILANTHILWTKPSELTFYSGLGIPIIMCPPLGAQERCNREWLLANEIGVDQLNPLKSKGWLVGMFYSGLLAQMARNGWECGRRTALYNVERLIEDILNETVEG